jgi:ABC-type dipeptide/oligopeptide/nickel transport system ATPase subunit
MSALELRDIVKHYAAGEEVVRAVDGVSLKVAPGELVRCTVLAGRARQPCC